MAPARRARRPTAPDRRSSGFTLLEMMAVVMFAGMLLTLSAGFYRQLTRSTTNATDRGQEARRGVVLLDRIAHDLEGSVLLVKAPEQDPLTHPWLFLGESRRSTLGADRLKFVSRAHEPRASAAHESDLVVLSYFAAPAEDGEGITLYRALETQLPEVLDRHLPSPDDRGVVPFAEGLEEFGVRFLDESGAWVSEWDSTTLERSGQLPVAAEINLRSRATEREPEGALATRQVLLPVRPFDLAGALAAADAARENGEKEKEDDDEADADCVTVGECVSRNQQAFDALLATNPELGVVVESISDQCFSEHSGSLSLPVENCE